MPYPSIRVAEARRYILAKRSGAEDQGPTVRIKPEGAEVPWDEVVARVAVVFAELRAEIGDIGKGSRSGARFEAVAARRVHGIMPENHPALADPEFWTWLVVLHFIDTVEWRYANPQRASDLKNYGIGSASENLIYRLWLRGELAFDETAADPYHLVELGDVDFWRSHLFRQSYANARRFARAFLRFQFPEELAGRPRLGIEAVRELAKRLRRLRTNLFVELMDEAAAMRVIELESKHLEAA